MEQLYFDKETEDMIYSRDDSPVVCYEKKICFDEVGTLVILYYDSDGTVLRRFAVPSDRDPLPTQKDVLEVLENRRTGFFRRLFNGSKIRK